MNDSRRADGRVDRLFAEGSANAGGLETRASAMPVTGRQSLPDRLSASRDNRNAVDDVDLERLYAERGVAFTAVGPCQSEGLGLALAGRSIGQAAEAQDEDGHDQTADHRKVRAVLKCSRTYMCDLFRSFCEGSSVVPQRTTRAST